MPKVAIILINYKDYAKRFLFDCYKSLENQSLPLEKTELFIVDNATSQESVQFLKKAAPKARILTIKENLGWAGGNNAAIRQALEEGFDYFIVLNMDVVLDKDWLKRLVEEAETRDDVHLFQSKILIEGSDKINSLGNRIQFLGYGFCSHYGDKDQDYPEQSIDYASGASLLVKKEVFERIGLFREEFFMYHDDLEFGWRARLAGFKISLVKDSVCYHKYIFSSTFKHIYYYDRNRLLTIFSLMKPETLLLILPMLIPFELAMTIYLGLQGKLKERFKVFGYLVSKKGRDYIKNVRLEVKNYRACPDREILKGFEGRVVFQEIDNPILKYLANPILALYWGIVRNFIIW